MRERGSPKSCNGEGRELPKDPRVHWSEDANSHRFLCGGRGGVPTRQCSGLGLGGPRAASQEGITPLAEAAEAIPGLLSVGAARVLQPLPEEVFVLLQHQELAKHHVGLQNGRGRGALLSARCPQAHEAGQEGSALQRTPCPTPPHTLPSCQAAQPAPAPKPCQSPVPPASCPGLHRSRPGCPLASPPWALPQSLDASGTSSFCSGFTWGAKGEAGWGWGTQA